MWYKTTEKKPEGYAGIVLYRRDRNKFNEGNWEEGIDMVIANGDTPSYLYDIVDGKDIGTRFIGEK